MRNILIDTVYVTHHKRLESTRPEHRLAAHSMDGRADQGGRGRNHPRLHRKDAGNVRSRTASVISRIPPRIHGRRKIGGNRRRDEPVRAFRSTGMGRNHKTQTRLPPIPDPGGWIDFTGMNYSNTNSAQQSTGGNKRQIQYIDDFDNVPDILYYPLEIVSRIDLIEGGNMVLWGCVSLETGWYYLDYDEKGKRIG